MVLASSVADHTLVWTSQTVLALRCRVQMVVGVRPVGRMIFGSEPSLCVQLVSWITFLQSSLVERSGIGLA